MAVVTPLPANHCIGADAAGNTVYQLKCLKGLDDSDDPIYTCAKWRKFRVNCPKVNFQCSNLSEAWVAAITVCNQKLF
jgi:hypothetical protein